MHTIKKKNYKNPQIENPLVKIFENTIEYCRQAKFPVYKPLKYCYDANEFQDNNAIYCQILNEQPLILVENIDSFDMAREFGAYLAMNDRILVLNLASDTSSGGGVKRGARAQEEDLYRKSNYFEANSQNLYPLSFNEVVYSPLVHIIKNSKYQLLQQPFPVACLAVAAIRNPKLTMLSDGKVTFSSQLDELITQNKINMIFKVAIKHGHKHLVLGALGCGAFNNPTKEIALMFKNSLNKYGKYFKIIGFAVLSGNNNPNYNIFNEILCGTT